MLAATISAPTVFAFDEYILLSKCRETPDLSESKPA
jgi:hypothetical protein